MGKLVLIPPPVYALALLALCQGLTLLAPLPLDISLPGLGIAVMAIGSGLAVWAWLHFVRARTTPLPTGQPSALVSQGPYRWSRNPMYLGILLVLSGLPFLLGSAWFFLASPGFFAVVDRIFVPYEEARLERLFGIQYREQKARVRRWC